MFDMQVVKLMIEMFDADRTGTIFFLVKIAENTPLVQICTNAFLGVKYYFNLKFNRKKLYNSPILTGTQIETKDYEPIENKIMLYFKIYILKIIYKIYILK